MFGNDYFGAGSLSKGLLSEDCSFRPFALIARSPIGLLEIRPFYLLGFFFELARWLKLFNKLGSDLMSKLLNGCKN